jgi:hypothetical protein
MPGRPTETGDLATTPALLFERFVNPPVFGEHGDDALEDEAATADLFDCGVRRNALWRAQPVEDGGVGSGAPGDDELVVNPTSRIRPQRAKSF